MQNISKPVEGLNLRLRLIDPDDAAYVCSLRTDPALSQYLSTVDGTVQDQRQWIVTYKDREARGEEFYFIIERRDGLPCGTVRLYEITAKCFTWGSWILDARKPRKAALESAMLSFGFGFRYLGLRLARIDVQAQNEHAIAFYRRFGMEEISESANQIEFRYSRNQFDADQLAYLKILKNEANT